MMLQELYDRWNEIQKQRSGNDGSERDLLAEELNVLEAMRILGCRTIPNETSDIQSLISERHKRMEEALRKREE